MPKSFAEVYDLYRQAADQGAGIATNQSLKDFAKDLNVWTGTKDFSAADTNLLSEGIKRGSYWIEKGIDATGVKKPIGKATGSIFDLLGANRETGRQIGESIPRMLADMWPVAIPGAGWAGLVGAGALSGANAWEKSGEPWQAATGFATPFVGAAGSHLATRGASALLSQGSKVSPIFARLGLTGGTEMAVPGGVQRLAMTPLDKVASYVAGNVGAGTAIDLAQRGAAAAGIGEGPGYDFFSRENILANVISSIPFAIGDINKFYKPMPFGGVKPTDTKPEVTEAPKVDEAALRRTALEVEYTGKREEAQKIKDEKQRQLTLAQLDQELAAKLKGKEPPKQVVDNLFGKKPDEVKTEVVKKNPIVFEELTAKLEEAQKAGEAIDKRLDAAELLRQQKALAEVAARKAGYERLRAKPKVETINEAEEVLLAAKAAGALIDDVKVSKKVEKRIQQGDSKEDAVKKEAQKVVNDTERKLSQADRKMIEASEAVAGLISRSKEKPEGFDAQVWAAIRPFYENPEAMAPAHPSGYAKKPNLADDVGIVYKRWNAARNGAEGPELIAQLVGKLQKTVGEHGYVIPTNRYSENGEVVKFPDKASAESKRKELGEDKYRVAGYGSKKKDGTYSNYALVEKKPAGMMVTKADVDATTEVVNDLVNTAEVSNAENLGLEEQAVGEIAAETIKQAVEGVPDEIVRSVMEDKEILGMILKHPELSKTLDTIRGTVDDDAQAMRSLVEMMLEKAGTKDVLKSTLTKLLSTAQADKRRIVDKVEAEQRKAFEMAEEAFNDKLSDFVEQAGQKWSPKDYNLALHYTQSDSPRQLEAKAHFEDPANRQKAELLVKFLNGQQPTELAAMLARIKAGAGMFYSMTPFDAQSRMFGKHPVPKHGSIPLDLFKQNGGKSPLQDSEIELYRQLVPEAFVGKAVDVPKLWDGLQKASPQVEIKKLGQDKLSKNRIQLNQLQHEWFDNLPSEVQKDINSRLVEPSWKAQFDRMQLHYADPLIKASNEVQNFWNDQKQIDKALLFKDLQERVKNEPALTNAQYAFVAPKAERDMPGYVEGLVRVPTIAVEEGKGSPMPVYYLGPHFGGEDANVLGFFRGYEETLPDGKKAFHIIEVQSDWGQQQRKLSSDTTLPADIKGPDHPLLSAYEALTLKAAIRHAQEVGADSIILSDAETAMMTEGHDSIARPAEVVVNGKMPDGQWKATNITTGEVKQFPSFEEAQAWKPSPAVPQSAGMRLHYDTLLPSILRKLTGEKGEMVELGVHQGAIDSNLYNNRHISPEEAATPEAQEWYKKALKGSPVFRDAAGKPKTQITGLKFSLANVPDEFRLFGNNRFMLGGQKAQTPPSDSLLYRARMLMKGRDPTKLSLSERDAIWQETGWMLSPDGSWRFEINDSQAKYDNKGLPIRQIAKLSDVLHHPDLYKQYPFLANIPFSLSNLRTYEGYYHASARGQDGSYDPLTARIVLSPKANLGTLLHEVQHAIQDYENFASGTTDTDFALVRSLTPDQRTELKQKVYEKYDELGMNRTFLDRYSESAWDKVLMRNYGDTLYRYTHGEQEAELTNYRQDWTDRERSLVAPYPDMDNPYFTVLPSLGTSFTLQPARKSRSNFEQDVAMPSFVRAFGIGLEKGGVDFQTARAVAEMARTTLVPQLGLEDVRFGQLINDVLIGDREVLGLAPVSGPFKRMWVAADAQMRGKGAEAQARNIAIQLAHEGTHLVEKMYNEGLMDQEGQKAWRDSEEWFGMKSEEEVRGLLNNMREMMLPKEWQDLPAVRDLMEYTSDPREAMATAMGIWKLGAVAKDFDSRLLSVVSPKPVRTWLEKVSSMVRTIFGAVKTALGVGKRKHPQVEELVGQFEKIRKGLAEGQRDLDRLQMLADVDADSFESLRTSALEVVNDTSVLDKDKNLARLMSRESWPADVAQGTMRQASRWFEYLEQMARRIPKLGEAAWSVLNAPIQKSGYLHRVMAPITGEIDPATGKPSPTGRRQKQLKLLERDDLRQLGSDILRHQNREQRFFDPKNQKDAQLAQRLDALPQDQREALQEYLEAKKVKNQAEAQEIVQFNEKRSTVVAASVLSSYLPEKHGTNLQAAELITQAEQMRLNQLPQEAAQLLAQADALIGDPVVRNKVWDVVKESTAARNKLAKFLESRPWFSSEIQTGKWRVFGFDKQGNKVGVLPADSNNDVDHVKGILRQKGAERFEQQEITRGGGVEMDDTFATVLDGVEKRMEAVLTQALQGVQLAPGQIADMVEAVNLKGNFEQFSRATNPVAPHTRKLSKQAEALDMLATDKRYSMMMANALVNSLTKARLNFELLNPAVKEFPEQVKQIKEGLNNYLKPDSEMGKAIVKFQAPYYLGLNLSSHFAELFQGVNTVLPEAVRETQSVRKAMGHFMRTVKDLGNFYIKRPFVGGKDAWQHWGSAEERRMLEQLAQEGLMTRHSYEDGLDSEGQAAVMSRFRAQRSQPVEFVKSVAKKYGDFTMGIYENFTRFNARLSALMGYRMAREQGLSHEMAIDRARRFAVTTTFSSGRAGRPVAAFGGSDNTLGMAAFALQRYSLSWMNMFARQLQHAMTAEPGKLGISAADQKAAGKTAALMAMTQFGAAGALGLPFMAAMTTILEKTLGLNLKGGVYEAFGQLMDQDDEEGGLLADVVMRGAANALAARAGVPVDLASKFALGGTPGFSEMQGFDSGSIFGPTASLVKSMANGVGSLAKDGDLMGFARQAFPPGLRKAIDVLANGDATSKEGNSYGLSDGEKALYAMGFTPDKVRKLRDFERFNDANNIKRRRQEAQQSADILELLEMGDHAGALQLAQAIVQESEGNVTMREIAGKVAEQKVKKKFPKDVRSEVTRADRGPAAQMLRGMGLNLGPSQEQEKAMVRNQILSMFGQAPTDVGRAARRDLMVEQDPWLASFAQVR